MNKALVEYRREIQTVLCALQEVLHSLNDTDQKSRLCDLTTRLVRLEDNMLERIVEHENLVAEPKARISDATRCVEAVESHNKEKK